MASSRGLRWALAVAASLALADASIVALALPRILTELSTTIDGVAAVIGVYTVVLAAALVPAARLGRAVGAPRLAVAALALFGLASIGCAASGSLAVLLVFRGIQALGGAATLIAAFGALGAARAGSAGRRLWGGGAVVGFAAGPAIGGALTQAFDWRAIFATQAPVALAVALWAGREAARLGEARVGDGEAVARERAIPEPRATTIPAYVALALLSAAVSAALFLLVLLLVTGWNLEPLAGAATVSVLPLTALLGRMLPGPPTIRAAGGCLLVASGVASLAYLPRASAWWAVPPQLLAGTGMGLALPALAGDLLPERSAREAARLLFARHAGIALALAVLAPVVTSDLTHSTQLARERGVALILDSPIQPQDKLRLAPALLAGVDQAQPRRGLAQAVAQNRATIASASVSAYDEIGRRADDTLVLAISDAFRLAFIMSAVFALAAAAVIAPKRGWSALAAVAAAALCPLAYVGAHAALAPAPVELANPCHPRPPPGASGMPGVLQARALATLDQLACHYGSSREALVLALSDPKDEASYKRRYGVDPTSALTLLEGMLGR